MKKKASSILIGLFTMVGLMIAGTAIVILGAGKYFQESHKIQLYFEKSVNGLQVGSDVRFGGVRIGRVSSISVIVDTKDNRKIIPVLVELTDKDLTKVAGGRSQKLDFTSRDGVSRAVKQGLRAGMKQQSLVTGQLYVEFDIVPDDKGFVYDSEEVEEFPVVPTIPTQFDEVIAGISKGLEKINELDLGNLITEMQDTLRKANQKISDLDLSEINENLTVITRDVRKITGDRKLATVLENLDKTLEELRELSVKVNKDMDPVMADIKEATRATRESMKSLNAAADEISEVTDPRSPLLLDFRNMLNDVETAARQLQELTDDLKRNPSSLLRGKDSQ